MTLHDFNLLDEHHKAEAVWQRTFLGDRAENGNIGIIGGIIFLRLGFPAFYIPLGLLPISLFYDYFRIKLNRVIRHRHAKA